MASRRQAALDNRSRQLNSQDLRYWESRGQDHVPDHAGASDPAGAPRAPTLSVSETNEKKPR